MSELCSSKCHFSSLVISDFIFLCSFILSHPLYFSYFIFFSPYLLKLVSFLSPLFITTFLLFLAFLVHTESSQTRFTSILESLQLINKDDELQRWDDLGIYDIVFGPPSMAAVREEENPSQISDQTPQKDQILEPNPLPIAVIGEVEDSGENKVSKVSETPVVMEEKRLENFLKILDDFERLASNVEEEKKKKKKKQQEPLSRGAKSDKVVEKQKSLFINGSEATAASNYSNNKNQTNDAATKLELNDPGVGKDCSTMAKSHSQRIIGSNGDDRESLSSYGSMRREREWKRTLACKLFEERHNNGGGGGGEGMDSLWEAYEVESNKPSKRSEKGRREKINGEREMEEDDEVGGQLCCLQALKMSAGKMNLGVGRPNLVKISKAIKGIGWLHNLTKNSKKVHNNGDNRY